MLFGELGLVLARVGVFVTAVRLRPLPSRTLHREFRLHLFTGHDFPV